MGRAGIEPATLGLKVDASASYELAAAMGMAQLSQTRFVCVRAVWDQLVDPLLTLRVACASNMVRLCSNWMTRVSSRGGFDEHARLTRAGVPNPCRRRRSGLLSP